MYVSVQRYIALGSMSSLSPNDCADQLFPREINRLQISIVPPSSGASSNLFENVVLNR